MCLKLCFCFLFFEPEKLRMGWLGGQYRAREEAGDTNEERGQASVVILLREMGKVVAQETQEGNGAEACWLHAVAGLWPSGRLLFSGIRAGQELGSLPLFLTQGQTQPL